MSVALNMAGFRIVERELDDTIDAGTFEMAEKVKQIRDDLVPVDTGDLKDSGEIEKVASGHYIVREGRGLPDARALYTEYGTRKMAAQPHMTPAVEQTDGVAIMKKHVQALLNRSRA